jgi:hypothetical protein
MLFSSSVPKLNQINQDLNTWYNEGTFGCSKKLGHRSSDVRSGVGKETSFVMTLVTLELTITSDSNKYAVFFKRLLSSGPEKKNYLIVETKKTCKSTMHKHNIVIIT